MDGDDGISHRRVSDLPELLGPGDVVVVNDTRVLPARLRMRRATGGAVEVLLLHERDDGDWEALVRPSRRLQPGEVVAPDTAASQASVEIRDDLGEGRRLVRVHTGGRPLLHVLDEVGVVPLPPYITAGIDDPERYQTVYGRRPVSAAAPTAGLHFTEELLGRVRDAGAKVVAIELRRRPRHVPAHHRGPSRRPRHAHRAVLRSCRRAARAGPSRAGRGRGNHRGAVPGGLGCDR